MEKNWRIAGRVLEENWGMGTGLARARHRWEKVGLPPMPEVLTFFNIGIIVAGYTKNKMLIRTTLPLIVQISDKTQKSNKTSTMFEKTRNQPTNLEKCLKIQKKSKTNEKRGLWETTSVEPPWTSVDLRGNLRGTSVEPPWTSVDLRGPL